MSSEAFVKDRAHEDHPELREGSVLTCKQCSYGNKLNGTDESIRTCEKCDYILMDSKYPSKERLDEDGNERNKIPPDFPEGGWGWIVVVASFFNSFIFDGIGSSFGVLYPYVHEKFQASAFVTSFAGSMFGAYLLMGSVSAFLIKKFGFRAVSFTGGLLGCISFVLASRASNVYMFLLTYGVMGGASVGLVYLPSMVIVNGYFNKRRGVTNGIISSGAGMGLLVLAPLSNALLDHYSLSGAVLILGGVLLNMCAFSCCFRQPRMYGGNKSVGDSADKGQCKENVCLLNNESQSENNTDESTVDNSLDCIQQHINYEEHGDADVETDEHSFKTVGIIAVSEQKKKVACPLLVTPPTEQKNNDGKLCFHRHSDNALFRELKTNHSQSVGKLNVEKSVDNSWMRSLNLLPAKKRFDKLEINQRKHPSHHSTNVYTDIGVNSYLTGSISHLVDIHNQHFASAHQLHTATSHQNCRSLSTILTNTANGGVHHDLVIVNNSSSKEKGECMPQDAKPFTDHEATQSSRDDTNILSKSGDVSCSLEIISETAGYSLRQLLKMVSFYLFCLGACLIQLGYPIPNIFLSDLAASHGIPSYHGALMISLIGSFNIGGRLLGGILANLSFNPIQLNDIAVFCAALLCFLCPFFTTTWSLCLFSALYGFLLGFFPPLQPLIIVKYFGIGSLASTFGFVTSLKGVAGLIGPPLAGWLYDVSLDYSLSIVFAGVAFLLSVIVNETLVYITKRDSR